MFKVVTDCCNAELINHTSDGFTWSTCSRCKRASGAVVEEFCDYCKNPEEYCNCP